MSTDYWTAILIAILSSTITVAISAPLEDATERLGLKAHRERVNSFPCNNSQTRSYKIMKILPHGQIDTNEVIFPPYTLIRRCDEGSGCCKSAELTCAPAVVEFEEVEVKVKQIVAGDHEEVRVLKIEQHKKCECISRADYEETQPNITLLPRQ